MPWSKMPARRTLSALFGRRSGRGTAMPVPSTDGFEMLEQRLALYQGPMISGMPAIGLLENQFDTVVRMNTNLGNIDIELFDYTFETTVNNFKDYVNGGKFDEMFFHSKAGNTLQVGRNKFRDFGGMTTIPSNPAIVNGFSRSNLARTISMIPDTSTTTSKQWLFNLQDNPSLNTLNGGYTVFGKVIQGWDVVLAIAALQTVDLDQQFTGSNPNPGLFDNVPVTGAFNTIATEETLVTVVDIEIVKTRGTNRYFEQTLLFPEGYRSATTVERIDMVNMDETFANFYQVIVRYETGDRDSVILFGTMQPGARVGLKVNDMFFPTYDIVRPNVGYAIEIRTTRAFAASLNHRDNGVTIGESFQLVARVYPGQLQAWNIAGGDKGPLFKSYILFQNLTSENAQVNVWIQHENGTTVFMPIQLKAARRGGIAVQDVAGIPDGRFSVRMTSNKPIVAAQSQYQTGGGSNLTEASTSIATINGGRTEGYLAAARVPTTGTSYIDVYIPDPNLTFAIVDFEFIQTNGTVTTGLVSLTSAARRVRYDIGANNPSLPKDTYFSIRYSSRNTVTPATVSYASVAEGDVMATAFQTTTSRTVGFGDGFIDPTLIPAGMSETISVFNPYATNVGFIYDLAFHFTDGTTILAAAPSFFSLAARARRDHRAQDFPAVMSKINSNPAFRFYSVEVISAQFTFPAPVGGVVAQITRFHNTWGQSSTSIPGLDARLPFLFLDNPEFH